MNWEFSFAVLSSIPANNDHPLIKGENSLRMFETNFENVAQIISFGVGRIEVIFERIKTKILSRDVLTELQSCLVDSIFGNMSHD